MHTESVISKIYSTVHTKYDFPHSGLLYLALWLLNFEDIREDVIHEVVKVGPINQPLSLAAWVHGSPAEMVISYLMLHKFTQGNTS